MRIAAIVVFPWKQEELQIYNCLLFLFKLVYPRLTPIQMGWLMKHPCHYFATLHTSNTDFLGCQDFLSFFWSLPPLWFFMLTNVKWTQSTPYSCKSCCIYTSKKVNKANALPVSSQGCSKQTSWLVSQVHLAHKWEPSKASTDGVAGNDTHLLVFQIFLQEAKLNFLCPYATPGLSQMFMAMFMASRM